ncbi:hypothetical protein LPB140_08570 [Sphingorhabdus lutea]|uniref:Uncharacterized protein n=1 Tax=Sphingorhabdus lutea TaxID=1913578 RepID=A0A1L3JCH1_9SPHN|nr:hypothetical protein [Sphingorhabdus lutea]APG62835.1 hypothetical protein LPB140_08570 [Sphingorhabdus lutea]
MIRLLLFSASFLNMMGADGAAAKSQEKAPVAIYGNVSMSEETGDLGGIELQFYQKNGQQMAEIVICEGWCNQSYHVILHPWGRGYRFSYAELYRNADGEIINSDKFTYWIEPAGKYYKIYDDIKGRPSLFGGKAGRLKKLSQRFGLAVANKE